MSDSDISRKSILDFIIAHAENDQRPYLEVDILGYKLLGLLDSGASRSIIGMPGLCLLEKLGFSLQKQTTTCTVANGGKCTSTGFISTPISLMGKTCIIDILVIPELAHNLILGIDFWREMEIVPDLRKDVWHFANSDVVESIFSVQDESTLTAEQKATLDALVEEKLRIMGSGLGCCNVGEHVIELLPGAKPIKQRYYPISPYKQKILDDILDEMWKDGVIEKSNSPWSSPVCLVPKKDGSYRFCVDYRKLNSVTKKDSYPIPYISSILDRLRGAKYLSSLDIKSAFWTVKLSEASKEYTAFTIPGRRGLMQWKRLPFGLTNSPATWQRIVDQILGAELEPHVFVYLDDIIVISSDFQSHLEILAQVFDRLLAAGLVVSKDKCQFCRPQLKYLGYVVDKHGLRPDPGKIEAMLNITAPRNVSEIRRFIGTVAWYKRFIPNFASILAPLTNLTRKNVKWFWSPDCEKAFKSIKQLLVTAPILTCPDFSRTFTLQTDASAYGIGAVLTQEFDDGEKVICYISRSLTRQERNLSTTERECLSVIYAVEKLRHYLEGVHFKIITDHSSLLWLHSLKDPQGRLARWTLRLLPYSFDLIHRPGKDHVVPDFLSRSVPIASCHVTSESINTSSFADTKDNWYVKMRTNVSEKPSKYPAWRLEDQVLYKYCKGQVSELRDQSDCWKLVIPKDFRSKVLTLYHDDPTSGHLGSYKTYWKVFSRCYWPKMNADINRYVKHCKVCGMQKPEQRKPLGLMGSCPKVTQPWHTISLDFMGSFPRSSKGNTHLLVVTDYFSKYVLTFPLRSATAKALVKHVEEDVFLVYGTPQYIICDNGPQMTSKEFKSLCEHYKVRIAFTPLYFPAPDQTERVNKVCKTMIRSYIKDSHRAWDVHLPAISLAIRTARHSVTDFTPYFINFGREHKLFGDDHRPRLAGEPDPNVNNEIKIRQKGFQEMFEKISVKLQSSHDKNKKTYDLRRRPDNFIVGQKVWRTNKCQSDAINYFSAKLAPKFLGPFIIHKKLGYNTYQLCNEDKTDAGTWHAQHLKLYLGDTAVT